MAIKHYRGGEVVSNPQEMKPEIQGPPEGPSLEEQLVRFFDTIDQVRLSEAPRSSTYVSSKNTLPYDPDAEQNIKERVREINTPKTSYNEETLLDESHYGNLPYPVTIAPRILDKQVVVPLIKLLSGMSDEEYAMWRYNTIGRGSARKVSLVDAQKAYILSIIQDHNLAVKLVQQSIPGSPSMIRETLTDETPQGRDIIKALNDKVFGIPEEEKKKD